jgi:ribosomal protein L16 Arg81 hydroxylase
LRSIACAPELGTLRAERLTITPVRIRAFGDTARIAATHAARDTYVCQPRLQDGDDEDRDGGFVAVRGADRACGPVAALARSVAHDLPGEQRTIVFATAKDSNGFGWHFDREEVFILQTAGDKSYYFRANSVSPRPWRADPLAFADYRKETTPLMSARLHAGDWLYLPSGYWHAAYAHDDSLSVSVGVLDGADCGFVDDLPRPRA